MEHLFSYFGNSLIAMFFISVLSGVIGPYISANRLNYFAGGIAHASFGGVGIAFFLGINPFVGAMVAATLVGSILGVIDSKGQSSNDSSIGLLWAFGMAIGIFFANITKGYKPNLLSYLFGDILFVAHDFVVALAVISIVVVVLSFLFYNKILLLSFDREFAKISGFNVLLYNIVIFVLISISIVFVIKSSGLILVISMITIPVMVSKLFTKDIKKIALLSFLIAFVVQLVGLLISIKFNFSTGPIIIMLLTLSFLILKFLEGYIWKK